MRSSRCLLVFTSLFRHRTSQPLRLATIYGALAPGLFVRATRNVDLRAVCGAAASGSSASACASAIDFRFTPSFGYAPYILQSPRRVMRVDAATGQPFPVYPRLATFGHTLPFVGLGQSTKSLRSSPLRGSKSREASNRSRGPRQRGEGQSDQQALCWPAAMIARGSYPHTAGRIDNTLTKIALTKARTSLLEYAVSMRLARN
jgi:hypothetical protein